MNVVIIGNGITGVTVATELRKKNPAANITIVSKESRYFYSRPALMYIYMGHMKLKDTQPYEPHFFKEQNINLVLDEVTDIDYQAKVVSLKDSANLPYDSLVLAVGSKANLFGWPGQDLPGVQTFYNLQDLELLEKNTKKMGKKNRAVVVGGGLIGVEVAEMLHARKIPVSLLVREENFWDIVLPSEEAQMVNEEIRQNKNIDLRLGTEVEEIQAGPNGRAQKVIVKGTGEVIDAQLVCFCVGVSPNVDMFKETELELGRGIKVDWNCRTNMPHVFAAGDCAEFPAETDGGRPLLQQVWYTGKMQAEVVAANIAGQSTSYDKGIWYNSAKFFELEYQTYGQVSPDGRRPDYEKHFFYRVPGQRKSIRLSYHEQTKELLGVNVFGIRYAHKVCEQWIADKRTMDYVLEHLGEANFDPEFYQHFEKEAAHEYKHQHQPA